MKQEHAIDLRKAAIIGCGFVGSATAFTLMQSKLFSELVLIDVDKARAEGEHGYQPWNPICFTDENICRQL